ncbi:hypothetical protein ViNHUV68_31170 [Vibrio sp. NH-UV-68]
MSGALCPIFCVSQQNIALLCVNSHKFCDLLSINYARWLRRLNAVTILIRYPNNFKGVENQVNSQSEYEPIKRN